MIYNKALCLHNQFNLNKSPKRPGENSNNSFKGKWNGLFETFSLESGEITIQVSVLLYLTHQTQQ